MAKGEEGLVHQPPDGGPGGEVGVGAVLAEAEGSIEGVLDIGEHLVERGEASLGGFHLVVDAPLLVSEEVRGDVVGVVGLEELAAFVVELGEPVVVVSAFDLRVGPLGAETDVDVLAQGG